MKERPILFSGPMVRAIQENRKTMTRRVVKFEPLGTDPKISAAGDGKFLLEHWPKTGRSFTDFGRCAQIECPYGEVGDKIWVRETWQCTEDELPLLPLDLALWAYWQKRVRYATDGDYDAVNPKPWKPSIHMPRWASRITLEITGVRVERLQDISEEDAQAEGVTWDDAIAYADEGSPDWVMAFRAIWDVINGERQGYAWKDNPWTWVLEFEKVVG